MDNGMDKLFPYFVRKEYARSQSSQDKQIGPKYVTCHLCAIDVPRSFIIEHYRSNKHKINTKITAVALERVKKSLDCNTVSDIDRTEALYFCPQCIITLNPKDRQSHDKTVVHKKALTVDKFLHDFYVLYSNEERSLSPSSDAEECDAMFAEANNVQHNNGSSNISDNNESMMINSLKISEKAEVKIYDIKKTDNTDNPSNKLDNSNLTKETPNKPIKTIQEIPNNTIQEIPNNTIQQIPNKPINGQVNANPCNDSQFCTFQNKIFCKVCKVYVPNNKGNISSHQKGSKHNDMLKKINKSQ